MNNPVRTTVAYALASGFLVVPVALMLSSYLHWSTAFKLTAWFDLALYCLLLARWSGTRLTSVLFPLVLLLGAALWPSTYSGFFILALGVLSWTRSGICFQDAPIRTLAAEVVCIVGASALVLILGGHTQVAQALNICLFFLVQTLYFFLVPMRKKHFGGAMQKDPFEQAVDQVNKILDGI